MCLQTHPACYLLEEGLSFEKSSQHGFLLTRAIGCSHRIGYVHEFTFIDRSRIDVLLDGNMLIYMVKKSCNYSGIELVNISNFIGFFVYILKVLDFLQTEMYKDCVEKYIGGFRLCLFLGYSGYLNSYGLVCMVVNQK